MWLGIPWKITSWDCRRLCVKPPLFRQIVIPKLRLVDTPWTVCKLDLLTNPETGSGTIVAILLWEAGFV